jgi:hypothetical protein
MTAALGLCMTLPLPAQEPARFRAESGPAITTASPVSINQRLADTIAEQLRQSDRLRHYVVDVIVQDGTAELKGTVADQAQHDEVIHTVQGVPGVEQIIDHLSATGAGPLTPVQAVTSPLETLPTPQNVPGPQGPNFVVEPAPVFQAPLPGPYDLNPPKMPPYAWPTYAPYNNYSRVAYPELYPHSSWPFIGPLYPFPKVPLGWRSVKLEWQDGHWWLSRYATPHDWWLLKYW